MHIPESRKYRITRNSYGSGDFTSTEYAIRNDGMSVRSEVVDNRHEALPNGRTLYINTCATGRLTIEQAEAFVEMIQHAIDDAKRR